MGGGFASSASQVGAQASVSHIDVAMVIASTLLFTEIGGAVGSALGKFYFFAFVTFVKSQCLFRSGRDLVEHYAQ